MNHQNRSFKQVGYESRWTTWATWIMESHELLGDLKHQKSRYHTFKRLVVVLGSCNMVSTLMNPRLDIQGHLRFSIFGHSLNYTHQIPFTSGGIRLDRGKSSVNPKNSNSDNSLSVKTSYVHPWMSHISRWWHPGDTPGDALQGCHDQPSHDGLRWTCHRWE